MPANNIRLRPALPVGVLLLAGLLAGCVSTKIVNLSLTPRIELQVNFQLFERTNAPPMWERKCVGQQVRGMRW